MQITRISDSDLVSQLFAVLASRRSMTADVVSYLGEVEKRRLHLKAAASSMFDFCQRKLKMSEGEAYRHIVAARTARRFPVVLELLRDGRLHLTGLARIAKYLTVENHAELLDGASGKTKFELEELIRACFPVPEKPASIRKLPNVVRGRHAAAGPSGATTTVEANDVTRSADDMVVGAGATRSKTANATAGAIGTTVPASLVRAIGTTVTASLVRAIAAETAATSGAPADCAAAEPASAVDAPLVDAPLVDARQLDASMLRSAPVLDAPKGKPLSRVEPIAAERYRIQLTVSSDFRDKLERALNLMSHRNPNRDLATAMERGLDLLLAALERERLARTVRSSSQNGVAAAGSAVRSSKRGASRTPPGNERGCNQARKAGAVSRRVRRHVFERDGERCSFVSETGERCPARAFLELDHQTPRARGGSGESDNIRVLCRAHNRLAAEDIFGCEHVEGRIHLRQRKRSAATFDDPTRTGSSVSFR